MKNLNKSNVLTSIESINQTLKKYVEKMILKTWVQNVPSSIKVVSFLLRNPRVKSSFIPYVQQGVDLSISGLPIQQHLR